MSETISETPVLISPTNLKSEPIERPHSPESNCAICLEEFTNKSFTNSCLHQFCYNCLREWSKIKPECPLCKQRFHTIIYNVRSLDDFDEYHVNTSNIEFDQTVFINFAFPASPVPYSFRNALDFRRNPIELRQRMVEADVYRAPMSASSSMLYIRDVNGLVRTTDTLHPATLPLEHDFRAPNLGLSRYRRDIYHRERWVRPAQSSRIRQSSPEFYRLNPAQTHRLVPWLTRELNVLLDVSIDPQNLVQDILNLITVYPIQSRHFREAMRPHLGARTGHFVHEFYHFAVSPHDIVSYDIMAEYGPLDNQPHRLAREESSESDSDVEVVNIFRGNLPVGLNGLDLSSPAGPSTSMGFPETIIEISDSSNSDHEVEIVGMISPVTPETIVIESTDEENEPGTMINSAVKNESSVDKINDSTSEPDYDPLQPCSSNSGVPSTYKRGFSPSSKETRSSSSSSTSSSSSSSSPSSCVYSSSLSSVSDSDYGRKSSSHKRKRRKNIRRDRIKRCRRRTRIESSSSDDFSPKKMLKKRLKSVVVKAEDNSVLSDTYSDSE